MLRGLIPAARQRISPSRGQHLWLGLQEVWRQEMLLYMEQEQSLEQVLSVYQLSPTCGVWHAIETGKPEIDWAPTTPNSP